MVSMMSPKVRGELSLEAVAAGLGGGGGGRAAAFFWAAVVICFQSVAPKAWLKASIDMNGCP